MNKMKYKKRITPKMEKSTIEARWPDVLNDDGKKKGERKRIEELLIAS